MTLTLCSTNNTGIICSICLSAVPEKMMMSSKYTKANCHLIGDKMTSAVCCKVHHALKSLNCMQEKWHNPWCELYAILSQSTFSIPTCQKLQVASKVGNFKASPSESIHLSTLGMGTRRVRSRPLTFDIPYKMRKSPFSFGPSTFEAFYSVSASSITFISNISLISDFLNSRAFDLARYGTHCKGFSCTGDT